jgi:riboflavin synthase
MFTGIVEALGRVVETGSRLRVRAQPLAGDVSPGESICVSGVCLTVLPSSNDGGTLDFDLSPETLERTSLGALASDRPVNLERAATLETRLGGHLVQGHVDGVGEVTMVREVASGKEIRVELPDGLARYVVEKGSIAVDGVSLTVTDVSDGGFGVALIPYTLEMTTLGAAVVGDPVNLEVDVLAKYVEGLMRGMA